jgi:hypothetical protein
MRQANKVGNGEAKIIRLSETRVHNGFKVRAAISHRRQSGSRDRDTVTNTTNATACPSLRVCRLPLTYS